MKITLEKIDKYVDQMLQFFEGDIETINEYKEDYIKSKDKIEIDNIDYCINNYVNSELDYITPGVRGLGRASDFWPRLGGYYRKSISKLSQEKIKELNTLITNLITKSYLFEILISDNEKESSNVKSKEELYNKWIPEIYLFNLDAIPQDSRNFLFTLIREEFHSLEKFFIENNIKSGVFSSNKTKEI